MSKHDITISIDELASGKLPKRVDTAIKEMQVSLAEVVDWQASKRPIHITITNKGALIEARLFVSQKKLLAVASLLVSILALIGNYLIQYLPTIQAILQNNR